jgi:hypothetical protein
MLISFFYCNYCQTSLSACPTPPKECQLYIMGVSSWNGLCTALFLIVPGKDVYLCILKALGMVHSIFHSLLFVVICICYVKIEYKTRISHTSLF